MTSRGIDAEIGTRPWHHFTVYASTEYLYATTDNNLSYGGTTYNTAGKIATSAPRWMAGSSLQYDDGTFFGNIVVKYVDREYSTFMNDQHIPGHAQVDLAVGARGHDVGFVKAPSIRFNVVNLADKHYLSGMYQVTPTAAQAPQYYVGPMFACMVTVSAGF